MDVHIHNIEVTIEHLCDTCQFAHKCVRFKGIEKALLTVEENSLDKWRVDVQVDFSIRSCDLYTADQAKLQAFAESVIDEYLDSMEDEEIIDRLGVDIEDDED